MLRKINFQPTMKAEQTADGKSLLTHSVFFTVQGEGPNAGMPAVFLRLGGCNLQCPGCDTEYSEGSAFESLDRIHERIDEAFDGYNGEPLVVITGGEPLRQNLGPLLNRLVSCGYTLQIETNGTLGIDLTALSREAIMKVQIVCSPKAGKVSPTLHSFITAYKYVLDVAHIDPKDGLPTSVLGLPAAPSRPHTDFEGIVYVQPADERNEDDNLFNLEACVEVAKRFGYRVGIQMHKLLGVE